MTGQTVRVKWIAVLVVAMSAVTAAPAEAAACEYGACYVHVGVISRASDDGAVARMTVERPGLGQTGFHSLAELSVGTITKSHSVEVGWTVDRRLNGDDDPHLFVFRWTGGPTCYNACGFTPAPGATAWPGMTLTPGTEIRVRISHIADRWAIFFNGEEFGSYPDHLWSAPWPERLIAHSFGEVASASSAGDVEMGGRISMRTFGRRAWCQPASSTDPRYFAVPTGRCAMRYGGPV